MSFFKDNCKNLAALIEHAENEANNINVSGNSYTQVRRFYDEFVNYYDLTNDLSIRQLENKSDTEKKVNIEQEFKNKYLPLVKMIKAKLSYAKARKSIDESFYNFCSDIISGIEDTATMRNGKLYFEAFVGFYKLNTEKNK